MGLLNNWIRTSSPASATQASLFIWTRSKPLFSPAADYHQIISLSTVQYDFSLETDIKHVFDALDAVTVDDEGAGGGEGANEETVAADDTATTENRESPKPNRPPIPKRGFERETG